MELSTRHAGLVRGLIYPVQFEKDPSASVDHVLAAVVDREAMGATPEEYLAAVRAALASRERLADLLPQTHPEEVIRRFLAAVGEALEKRLSAHPT